MRILARADQEADRRGAWRVPRSCSRRLVRVSPSGREADLVAHTSRGWRRARKQLHRRCGLPRVTSSAPSRAPRAIKRLVWATSTDSIPNQEPSCIGSGPKCYVAWYAKDESGSHQPRPGVQGVLDAEGRAEKLPERLSLIPNEYVNPRADSRGIPLTPRHGRRRREPLPGVRAPPLSRARTSGPRQAPPVVPYRAGAEILRRPCDAVVKA